MAILCTAADGKVVCRTGTSVGGKGVGPDVIPGSCEYAGRVAEELYASDGGGGR